jgi:hypothetical protein
MIVDDGDDDDHDDDDYDDDSYAMIHWLTMYSG